ncbi:MAG: helix-turn-helix transcriptional regulator [Oscillospiraceae bacterium]|nr:helix-turn-helix transcriptional regulator [Oscillospiraceae bacterium]
MRFDIENLNVLNVLQCVSAPFRQYRNRDSHAFIFRRCGTAQYDFDGQKQIVREGQIIFLPKGSSFSVEQLSQGISRYTVINFQGKTSLSQPVMLPLPADPTRLYPRLDRCCTLEPEENPYLLLSEFYWILSQLLEAPKAAYHSSRTLQILTPVEEYLQSNLFDPELKTGSLHRLCGVSDTYFRKLFWARYGTSPKKYILDRRLRHARELLISRECTVVAEAAQLSGFTDPLYFSRLFRERYGYPPSHTASTPE